MLLISVILALGVPWAHGEEVTCNPPSIPNGHYRPERNKYSLADVITYQCTGNFYPATRGNTARCTSTGWEPPPRCSLKSCNFPEIKYGSLLSVKGEKPVPVGTSFYYLCNDNFVTHLRVSLGRISCTQEGWLPAVPCRRRCFFNYMAQGYPPHYKEYLQGDSLRVDCLPGHSLPNQQTTITCTESGWSSPPMCLVKYCGMPVFKNARAVITGKPFGVNDTLDYKCLDGYENQDGNSTGSMVCDEDGWTHLPTCHKSSEKCGHPPSISNGDTTSFPLTTYLPGSRIEYQCQVYYELRGSKYVTCNEGEWSEPPTCIDPCVITEQNMNKNNIQLKGKDFKTYYVKTGDVIEFVCKSGHTAATSQQSFQAECQEGTVEYPRCD